MLLLILLEIDANDKILGFLKHFKFNKSSLSDEAVTYHVIFILFSVLCGILKQVNKPLPSLATLEM